MEMGVYSPVFGVEVYSILFQYLVYSSLFYWVCNWEKNTMYILWMWMVVDVLQPLASEMFF